MPRSRTFSRAMREDPRNETTHAQLDRLARGLDKWPEVAALYDQVANEAQEDDLKVALLFRRAQIQEHELRDDEGAVATYERVLKASPQTVEAATAIQTIHERTGDWPKLVDILKRKSEMLPNVEERKQLLFRAAQIEEEVLGNADAAIATFRQVLSIDDVDMTAMDALERMYVRLARWEPLKDVYAKKADLAEDPDDKKRDALRARAGLRPRARRRREGDRDLPGHPRSRRRRAAGDPVARPPLRSGRALVRPARQPRAPGRARRDDAARPSRSSTASVTCGRSASATSRARSRATARRSRWIRRTPRRCTRSTGWCTARSSRSWRLACSSRSTRPAASTPSSSTSSR